MPRLAFTTFAILKVPYGDPRVAGFEALTPQPPRIPICIVHGWHDDIVPVENSIRYARSCSATLHIVDGDHRLTENVEEIKGFLGRFVEKLSG